MRACKWTQIGAACTPPCIGCPRQALRTKRHAVLHTLQDTAQFQRRVDSLQQQVADLEQRLRGADQEAGQLRDLLSTAGKNATAAEVRGRQGWEQATSKL